VNGESDGREQTAEDKRKVVVVLIYRLRPPFLAARSAASVAGGRQLEPPIGADVRRLICFEIGALGIDRFRGVWNVSLCQGF
jgi:hypothetical protein